MQKNKGTFDGGHLLITALGVVYIAFLSCILYENYHSIKSDYETQDSMARSMSFFLESVEWMSFFRTMKCCGTSGQQSGVQYGLWYPGGPYWYYCSYTEGCVDVIQNFVEHYGILYLVFLSVNTVTSMVAIGATEYMYRTVTINKSGHSDLKKIGEQWKCSNGMIGDIFGLIKRSCSVTLYIAKTIVEVGFGIAIYLYYFLMIHVSTAEYYLGKFYRLGFNMLYIMNGTVYTLMVVIPLSVILHPLFFWLTVRKKQHKLLYVFMAKGCVFLIGDILLICMSSLILDFINMIVYGILVYLVPCLIFRLCPLRCVTYIKKQPVITIKVNECDSAIFSYNTAEELTWFGFCSSYAGNVRNMVYICLGFLGFHFVMNIVQAAIIYKIRTRHVKVGNTNEERVIVQTRIIHEGVKKKQRINVKRDVPLEDRSSSNRQTNVSPFETPANDDEGIETLTLDET